MLSDHRTAALQQTSNTCVKYFVMERFYAAAVEWSLVSPHQARHAAMIQIDFSQSQSRRKKTDLTIDRRSSRRAGRFGSVSIVSLHKLSSHGAAHGGLAGGCIYLFQFLLR